MLKIKQLLIPGLMVVLTALISACNVDVDRNADGSLNVEASLTEAAIQDELKAAIADPLIEELNADLRDGYILVTGERRRLSGDQTDTMSFRLDLGASNGQLAATVSDAKIDDIPISEERLKLWNERIANRLARAGRRNPNSSLQTVTVSNEAVKMIWRVETARSQGD